MVASLDEARDVIPAAAMSLIGNTTCVMFGGSILAARLVAEAARTVYKSCIRASHAPCFWRERGWHGVHKLGAAGDECPP